MYLALITNIFKFFFNKRLVVTLSILLLNNLLFAYNFDTLLQEKAGFNDKKLLKIDKVFNEAVDNKEILGTVIAIARYDKIVYKKAFGIQDPKDQIPMPENSISRIYSMIKPIIIAATVFTREDGVICLNANLDNYISTFNNTKVTIEFIDSKNKVIEKLVPANNKIKIYNLLTHTSELTYANFGDSLAKNKIKFSNISKLNLEDFFLNDYVKELSNETIGNK